MNSPTQIAMMSPPEVLTCEGPSSGAPWEWVVTETELYEEEG